VVPLPAFLGQQGRHHCPCRLCNVGMSRVLVSMRDSEVVVEVQHTITSFFLWRRLPSSFAPRRPSLPLNSQKQPPSSQGKFWLVQKCPCFLLIRIPTPPTIAQSLL